MVRHRKLILASLVLAFFLVPAAQAVDTQDTRMLIDPTVSAENVAFLYAGDVWTAKIDGSSPRRLTSHSGNEIIPRGSPPGFGTT